MADPEAINGAADDIVSQPQYQPAERGLLGRAADWVGDALEPVADLLNRFLEWLGSWLGFGAGIGGAGGSGGFLLGWIVLAVGAAALVWFLVRVMPRRRLRSKKTDKPTIEHRQRDRFTRKQWLERAEAAEAERNYTAAVRARYRALAAGLADHDELDPSEAATSGEHLRAFDATEPRREQFRSATDRYERAWFGNQPVDVTDSEELSQIDRVLVEGDRS